MDQQLTRIGFVGCGGNGKGHLHRLKENAESKVVAVCDVNEALAQEAAGLVDAQVFNDHKRMLDEQELDAVYLSIPPFAHGQIELDIIERGLPFFVEKPVALNLHLANEIAAAARKKNVLTCVGYQLRYATTTDAAREALENATIGLVTGVYWTGTGRAMVGKWWEWQDKSGGQLVEQATHTVDMMRYLAGEIEEVFAFQNQRILDKTITDCPDVSTMALRFSNGAVGTFSCTPALDTGDSANANIVEVTFDDSRLRWTYGSATITKGSATEEKTGELKSIDDVFVRAVRTGDRSLIRSDYDDALKTLAVTLAAHESARTDQPVRVADFIKQHS